MPPRGPLPDAPTPLEWSEILVLAASDDPIHRASSLSKARACLKCFLKSAGILSERGEVQEALRAAVANGVVEEEMLRPAPVECERDPVGLDDDRVRQRSSARLSLGRARDLIVACAHPLEHESVPNAGGSPLLILTGGPERALRADSRFLRMPTESGSSSGGQTLTAVVWKKGVA